MEVGKCYKVVPTQDRCDNCNHEKEPTVRRFPFGEEIGMFLGVAPSGFLMFRLSGLKNAMMNGGSYEEVIVNVSFVKV